MTIDRDELRQRIEEELYEVWTQRTKRRYNADLRVWERHRPVLQESLNGESEYCHHCDWLRWECPDYIDLAARYEITP